MLIRGVALLSGCFLAGQLVGETIGRLIHIDANVGGVGFAMLFLVYAQNWLEKRNKINLEMESGILFWSKMYIPVIVAMAATQNVRVALSSGAIALLAGIIPVILCLVLVPIVAKLSLKGTEEWSI
ncbi:malonate transporter subunit MadL [Spirosoma flavum]|uniref:Malonate transporter subunit MadL n=1 Tax=Spirosoma flavum TaxID=2048557 RepID=A0ABW6AHY3_9BACT